MVAKTSAQTTRKNVVKYRNAGLIQSKIWVHPGEAARVRAYAARQPATKRARGNLGRKP